ncbi:MAG: DUF1957 domain-containing protein, partial [Elusimicrobia bacterium]|nr:DUF1957 domain-containing protein [Elusimicrobiota bacterium]
IGLYEQIMGNRIEEDYLNNIEWKDNIFPEIDYRVYLTKTLESIYQTVNT